MRGGGGGGGVWGGPSPIANHPLTICQKFGGYGGRRRGGGGGWGLGKSHELMQKLLKLRGS